jgi:hypothetical protein
MIWNSLHKTDKLKSRNDKKIANNLRDIHTSDL